LDIKDGIMIKADFMRQRFSTHWRDLSHETRMHPITARAKTIGANRIAVKIRISRKNGGQVGIAYVLSAVVQRDLVARTLWLLNESVERIKENWCTACLRDQKKND
jgi:hypothetical protein